MEARNGKRTPLHARPVQVHARSCAQQPAGLVPGEQAPLRGVGPRTGAHTGIHFQHRIGKGAHAPGFYFHLEPQSVFIGVGIWQPDGPTCKRLRDTIVEDPASWKRARDDKRCDNKRFRSHFELSGEVLKRPPRGYDPDHPYVEDLKRKDFVGVAAMSQTDATAPDFLDRFSKICTDAGPFVRWLCRAIDLPF